MSRLPDYVYDNQAHWDRRAHQWVEMGRRAWRQEPRWGIWGVPEDDLRLLPPDMRGMTRSSWDVARVMSRLG